MSPWIGGTYCPRAPRASHATLQRLAVAALCAQRRFEREAPSWAQPLPLRADECEALLESADSQLRLVGHYGLSLRIADWDYDTHPSFDVFCKGMDYPAKPCLHCLPF